MLKIGITGQSGFIGTHFYNYLGIRSEEIIRIPFQDHFFDDHSKLENFVKNCDVIVHLAALNRHNEPKVIYDTNIDLIYKLISSLESTGSRPHILFSSSTHEERGTAFGSSKREGRELLAQWSEKSGSIFTGLVIPNVFGPFGNPYYNSVIATFSHQLTHNEIPKIDFDGQLKLIYVDDLVKVIYDCIMNKVSEKEFKVPYTDEIKVSEILKLLKNYKSLYFEKGIFPDLSDTFAKNLFNTFICYMDLGHFFPVKLRQSKDERGSFVETIKLNSGGQVSFSTTRPGVTRGNHFHTRKAERFAVIKGKAIIQLRRIGTGKVLNYELDGQEPAYVDMPVWHTHNITNVGNDDLYTFFWINEHFNPDDPDSFYEMV